MSPLSRILCSRLLPSARPLSNHILHSTSPFPTRNYSADNRRSNPRNNSYRKRGENPRKKKKPDEDSEIIKSRLQVLRDHFRNQFLIAKDDYIQRGLSTHEIQDALENLPTEHKDDADEEEESDEDDEGGYYDDSDSDDDDDGEAQRIKDSLLEKRNDQRVDLIIFYEKLIHKGLYREALKCMKKIHKLEDKISNRTIEDRVIGELKDRLKVAEEGKDKFLLQMKLNRAIRMVENRKAFDPNNPANYGVIQGEQGGFVESEDEEDEMNEQADVDEEPDDMRDKDTVLLQKLSQLDKQLENKLAELDHTFGKKGKLLEEEIKELAEERNSLTEQKRQPLYRKGFDVKIIDVNRTCKVTKGGQIAKYTVMLACGNYNGTVGFAKAKGPAIPAAIQKAHEKCFQNLHYIERHEEHTIAHAIQTSHKKTKVYLWPAPAQTGMKAGKTVQIILSLAGFKNVKSKVIGSRNAHNTVKAVFKALNAVETPKDVQEKFGRTVVESYLL